MATNAPLPLPKVQLTAVFRQELVADGADPKSLIDGFAEWKDRWPLFEHAEYYFGKDGEYHSPTRTGKRVLSHVHMTPEDPDNWPANQPPLSKEERVKVLKELEKWDKRWRLKQSARNRTSSRVLVYVDGGRHGYLLLHLAKEPNGHDETTANLQLLHDLADVAEAFIYNGTILI